MYMYLEVQFELLEEAAPLDESELHLGHHLKLVHLQQPTTTQNKHLA